MHRNMRITFTEPRDSKYAGKKKMEETEIFHRKLNFFFIIIIPVKKRFTDIYGI